MKRLALLAALIPITPAQSQLPSYEASVAMRPAVVSEATASARPQQTYRPEDRFAFRLATGSVGLAAGALGGGLVANALAGHPSEYEWGNFWQIMVGASIGGLIGTGVGVGVPAMGDGCHAEERMLLGLGGAATGAVIGLLGARLTNGYAVPVGAVVVGSALAGKCKVRTERENY